jgi:hypothetical protein
MTDTTAIELNATEVWRVLKALEQALEVLHEDLEEDLRTDPALDPIYRGYLELYERFKRVADVLPEPEFGEIEAEDE